MAKPVCTAVKVNPDGSFEATLSDGTGQVWPAEHEFDKEVKAAEESYPIRVLAVAEYLAAHPEVKLNA